MAINIDIAYQCARKEEKEVYHILDLLQPLWFPTMHLKLSMMHPPARPPIFMCGSEDLK